MDHRVVGTSAHSRSLLHSLYSVQCAPSTSVALNNPVQDCLRERFLDSAVEWSVVSQIGALRRRVTCLEWHPRYHNVVAVGTHSGDILLWKYEDEAGYSHDKIEGIGMGYGCISEMKFHPRKPSQIYSTAIDGSFCLRSFDGCFKEVYLDSTTIDYWLCGFGISQEYNVLFVADNRGNATLLDADGNKISEYKKLHKGKIKTVEFCPAQSWMMATASVDRSVSLWDIRMLRSTCDGRRTTPISNIKHEAPVSSALFDPLYGNRLLTTSQNGDIRVYDPSPQEWNEPTIAFRHSHRFFQHITEIKGTWHPLYNDLCVVGRYPRSDETDQSRTIDLMDLKTGNRVGYFYSASLTGIFQVNKFNKMGDTLVSGMGASALAWKCPDVSEMAMHQNRGTPSAGLAIPLPQQAQGDRRKRKREKRDDKGLRKKLKYSITDSTLSKKKHN